MDKSEIVWQRDDKGELIPQEVEVPEVGKVLITPLTWGEWKRYREVVLKDSMQPDIGLLLKHIIEPRITDDDLKALKPRIGDILIKTVLEVSGLLPSKQEVPLEDGGKSENS